MAKVRRQEVKIPRLTKRGVTTYEQYAELRDEASRLSARLQVLNAQKRELGEVLNDCFNGSDLVRIRAGCILKRNEINVAARIQKIEAYSYVKYKEVEG